MPDETPPQDAAPTPPKKRSRIKPALIFLLLMLLTIAAGWAYNETRTSGRRVPWDIPVEDFLFGWALVTAVLLLWVKQGQTR